MLTPACRRGAQQPELHHQLRGVPVRGRVRGLQRALRAVQQHLHLPDRLRQQRLHVRPAQPPARAP